VNTSIHLRGVKNGCYGVGGGGGGEGVERREIPLKFSSMLDLQMVLRLPT